MHPDKHNQGCTAMLCILHHTYFLEPHLLPLSPLFFLVPSVCPTHFLTCDIQQSRDRGCSDTIYIDHSAPVWPLILQHDRLDPHGGLGTPREPSSILQRHISLAPLVGLYGSPTHTITRVTDKSCIRLYEYQTGRCDGYIETRRWH